MRKLGTIVAATAIGLAALVALSGGTSQVPQTPAGPDRMPTPFLGVAVIGSGGPAAAVDAFGSVVELRAPGPAGSALISTPYRRQRAGSVDPDTGIVMRASAGKSMEPRPLWTTEPRQRYLDPGNILETQAQLAGATLIARDAMAPRDPLWARDVSVWPGVGVETGEREASVRLEVSFNFDFGGDERERTEDREVEIERNASFAVRSGEDQVSCRQQSPVAPEVKADDGVIRMSWTARGSLRVSLLCRFGETGPDKAAKESVRAEVERVHTAAGDDARQALAAAKRLSRGAPGWAHRLHRRSILALLALSDRNTGAAPAGLRDHWQYIWPRDAATVALALQEAGLDDRAVAIADFIAALDAEHAARFDNAGAAIDDGRHQQGDSAGWARLAQTAVGRGTGTDPFTWRNRGDYGERDDDRGDYLANAIVAGATAAEIETEFAHAGRLYREAGASADSALDTAAAWAVRPFPQPTLYPLIRATLLELAATAGPFGLFPSSDWVGRDPWTAATASTAWSLAALGEREEAQRLMRAVNRAATPLGLLPERADIENGLPRSTTPLAWSHAFAILTLQELWPPA